MMDASTELRMKTQSHTNWDATVPALWQSPMRRDACKHQHSSTHYPHYQHVHRRRLEARKLAGNIADSCCLLFFSTYIISHCQIHLIQISTSMFLSNKLYVHAASRPLITSLLIHCDLPLSLEGVWHGEAIRLLSISTLNVLLRHLIQSFREPWFHHHHQWAVLGVGGAWVRVSFQFSFYHFKMFSFSLVFSFDRSF